MRTFPEHRRYRIRPGILAAVLLCLVSVAALGGLGPLNTLVVVNGNSDNSRALGAHYARRHGIPTANICRIHVPPTSSHIALAAFERDVDLPIQAHIANHGLAGQIHAIVLCMDIPSRVNGPAGVNGITSVLFYGYKTNAHAAPLCSIAPDSVNQYYASERAYTSTAGWNRTNTPLVFLLTAPDLPTAKAVVDRAAESIHSSPPADALFCLYGSPDAARNVRHRAYSLAARPFALASHPDAVDVRPSASIIPSRPVLGYMTGRAQLPTNFIALRFAPGAIADHLTSCAGMIPDPCSNQSTVWDWLRLGATASYGTVTEPCAFEAKFPAPMLFYWYSRGFTAGEALAMSVRNPYQGIFVGDPLAAPFARPPRVTVTPSAITNATLPLRIELAARPGGIPPVFLDLYLDGRHHAPITRPFAPVGNDLILTVGPRTFRYTIAPGEDLYAAAAGLAWAVNSEGEGDITASARSDRLELTVSKPLDANGAPLSFFAATEQGFAGGLYVGAVAGSDRLVVDSDGIGRAMVTLHLGHARTMTFDYPLPLADIPPGNHLLTFVVRDGSAVQTQSQTTLSLTLPAAP